MWMWQSVIKGISVGRILAEFYQVYRDGRNQEPGLHCGTRLKRRPVNCLLELFVRLERCLECEGELCGAMLLQVSQTFGGLIHAGTMASGNPPESGIGTDKLFEPRLSLTKKFGVGCWVNIRTERFDCLPN